MWFLYNIAFVTGYTLLLPYFAFRMIRRGGYRTGFLQRFGAYDEATRLKLGSREYTWIHAVSVGEVNVALSYMAVLRAREPEAAFVITTNTPTGRAVAAKGITDADVLLYFPVDLPWIIRRVLDQFTPRALLLVESEVWPNLIRQLNARGRPIAVVNGRMSKSSYRGYSRLKPFVVRTLQLIDAFLVQTESDREHFAALGARDIRVMGSAKYDIASTRELGSGQAEAFLDSLGIDPNARIVVGGSTWPGEEDVLLECLAALKPGVQDLKLVLVPRHAERAADVEKSILKRAFNYVRKSRVGPVGTAAADNPDVILVDTTGELVDFYSVATVVFVGKSLLNEGGQNFIEPACLGRAVVVGPHLENFPVIAEDFQSADAFVQVKDPGELESALRRLLTDEQERSGFGNRARKLVASRSGVVARSIDVIETLLADA